MITPLPTVLITTLSCRAFWVTTVWSGWETVPAVTQPKVIRHRAQGEVICSQVAFICQLPYRPTLLPEGFLTFWLSSLRRRLCGQELPHELWPCGAEDQGAEHPHRGRRVFRAIDSYRGAVGKEGSHSTESLQQRDRHVWWSFPLLSGGQHPG